ncbi:MAG: MATE family efflux transporter, partial [Clostridia bacterium]|nr:MATE family efflux transporter [Clostridia bacterium]
MAKQFQLDMSQGSIFKNTIRFAIPLIFASLLQLFYNAADLIVVSRFAGSNAMASVGATSSVTNLLVNVFIGLSLGAGVAVSRRFGANDREGMKRTVHTAMLLGMFAGILSGIIGIVFSKPLLVL